MNTTLTSDELSTLWSLLDRVSSDFQGKAIRAHEAQDYSSRKKYLGYADKINCLFEVVEINYGHIRQSRN